MIWQPRWRQPPAIASLPVCAVSAKALSVCPVSALTPGCHWGASRRRKRQREAKKKRKEAEMAQHAEEIKRLKNLKKKEIEEK